MDLPQIAEQLGLDGEDRTDFLFAAAVQAYREYHNTGDIDKISFAVICARLVMNGTVHGHPDRARRLNNLGVMLGSRYERTGEMTDLQEAIDTARQAVKLTPEDHPKRAAYLNNLGNMLGSRYERIGEMTDFQEAINVARQAVELTPEDHPNRAASLNNLGDKLGYRYDRTGEMTDLQEAIDAARQAVELTPEDHPNRALWLDNLGNKLGRRYERTGEMTDLQEAIDVARQAVESIPKDHPDRPGRLNNLGNKLGRRYERTSEMTDLQEAIDAARQAVELTPEDHPDRALWLNNLGVILGNRYKRTGEMTDLQEAIDAARQAVELTPEDHYNRALWLNNLGNKLKRRYQRTGKVADLQEASNYLLGAWNCRTAIPFHRIQSGAQCLRLFAILREVSIAIDLGKDIIDLLPTVNTRLLSRADQQFVVATFAGVAAELCAFLLESNCSEEALVYLERGRAIIIGQLIDSRSDVSSLAQLCPEIARRYEALRDEVSGPFHSEKLDAVDRQMLNRRRKAVAELSQCIEEIRSIPGHERFLLGQTITQMQECAMDSTIIVINLAEFRSDAIIVSASTIKTLNLPELSALEAKDWLSKNWAGRRSERKQKNEEYSRYLFWLWESCVKQVLDEVFAIHNSSDLPRIWWIGTGLASSMPFHAAGTHSAASKENVYSRAISSYTPSIKALSHARNRAKATDKTYNTLLMATMSTTPGCPKPPDLPGVVEEKNKVLDIANGHLPLELLDQPSVDRLIERLRHCSVAHFACHGFTDHSDPSNSGLILQRCKGNQPPEQDRLTVQRVSELSLTHARIAYLSACSTAENKATRLSDEVIHVVSGFQVAGFPHVVGCLWPSNDRVCVEVAGEFYTTLLRQGGMRWGSDEVASALRGAVMAVRAKEMSMPLNWAQFVHYGP